MKMNQVGKSDITVSALTLGCMSLGTDRKKAESIIDRSLDMGVNHLDTADLYNFGLNEEIVGEAIKPKRGDIILTTKVGNHFNKEKKDWFWDPSEKHIKNGIKDSLKRLQTDYIDLYLLHGGTIEDNIDESIHAFEDLKKEGLIRAYGISSIRPNVIREYVRKSNIDAVMMQYSLLDRRPEEELLDLLHANSISVLARGPLAKGMLSNESQTIIENKGKNGFLNYSYQELKEVNEQIKNIKADSFNELSLKYVLKHPGLATAVFGASSIEQAEENLKGDFKKPLDNKIYVQLQQITKPNKYDQHR
ncbi:aldo/keto reductase [Virgibacillus sp. YIM 98842]|jgi:aryl-alcohol dehydrogenase-like predicted oxidoreductase|uniref:aldo/keto reductase n=1 Tax=Virgibacillus sp. YIM 98842 TaxID=2663533 RepID=UPI0013DB976D|nr:aldo/keto reductase [Virgibacillus sp. YIM 98842]